MRILVCAATKHGAAEEVAEIIAGALLRAGLEVSLRLPHEVESVTEYDAAILGSAVYRTRWLAPMCALIARHADALAERPVWLFSVGPIGVPPRPVEEPPDGATFRARISAREHRVFPGRLTRSSLDVADRGLASLLRLPDGDFRPLPAIEEWAEGIARVLLAESAAAGPASL